MTTTLFEYPKKTFFGRMLPKSKIYEHGKPISSIKDLFVRQVEQIVWQYKLAPETINIKGTQSVPEIQIFSITLKDDNLKPEVLRCIDEAIPYPILYELRFNGKIKAIAAYKRPGDANYEKWSISEYFEGYWVSDDTLRQILPIVIDLEALYHCLLTPLMPYATRPGEKLSIMVARMEQILLKQREIERYEAKLRKEKQFNRKVLINAELRKLKQELESLTRPLPSSGG